MEFQITDTYEDDFVSVQGVGGSGTFITPKQGTGFIAVERGGLLIDGSWLLSAGFYACTLPNSKVAYTDCRALIVIAKHYDGFFSVGGTIEKTGRLRYIDGCSDTALIPPPKLGDPCLNFLHFPSQIDQTRHTHSSLRAGIVMRGFGVCKFRGGFEIMEQGDIFVIPPNIFHSFHTDNEIMDIVAFNPDSAFGPTDEQYQLQNVIQCK